MQIFMILMSGFDDDLNDLNPEVSISSGPQPLNTTTDTKITAT